MKNTKWQDNSSQTNPQFICVILQYVTKLNADAVKKVVADANPGIGRKHFNFQLASSDDSFRLTGYAHNAVVPVGMKLKLPIILSDQIPKLELFWLGAGEVDLKLGVNTKEFCRVLKPTIARVVH
eukprot:TRINITY_DN17979_c0_g1_i2.p1 TRINITY_DN17979_c0_g1~~TRINITY_DN17979_c0_g1_i2.p1  ORF type:complete len:125 (-),score=26.21 TRINITY_DN17979_c0_g1_i2:169-543(-)